ncbi:MAG: DUF5106 domain-containing protein [Bacteroidales bacterium]|nr:DUF5106 domain-containing protein [Bacteroidales bacterium]
MKNLQGLFVLLTCTCVTLFAQNNYSIDFHIHQCDDSLLYIISYCGDKTWRSDSMAMQKDGSFHLQAEDYAEGMYMVAGKYGNMFSFVMEKNKQFSIEIYPSGEYYIKNSPENEQFFMYQLENRRCQGEMEKYKLKVQENPSLQDSLRKAIMPVIDSFSLFQKQFFASYPDNLITVVTQGMNQSVPPEFLENGKLKPSMQKQYMSYYRQHYWDNFHFADLRILYSPYFFAQFKQYIEEVTIQYPDSVCRAIDDFVQKADADGGREYADYILTWYLDNYLMMPFSFNEMVFMHIADKYLDRVSSFLMPSAVEEFKEHAQKIKPFLPGNVMPNMILQDFDGKYHRLYMSDHEYTIVYFFSSMCESCKKNLDELKSFYWTDAKKYDAEIYSIDIEPDIAICRARQQSDPFEWIVVHATAQELEPYHLDLDHTPQLYILDKNKRIINKTAVYNHVRQAIEIDFNGKNLK